MEIRWRSYSIWKTSTDVSEEAAASISRVKQEKMDAVNFSENFRTYLPKNIK